MNLVSANSLVVFVLLCVGCESSNPSNSLSSETPMDSQTSLVYVRLKDYEAYLEKVRSSFIPVLVMIKEFETITSGWVSGFIPAYWTEQYLSTLLGRLDSIEEGIRKIRPAHPELLHLHVNEYEPAFEDFRRGFNFFLQHLEFLDVGIWNQMNEKISEGNVHLIRFQILLGDLGNRKINLGIDGD